MAISYTKFLSFIQKDKISKIQIYLSQEMHKNAFLSLFLFMENINTPQKCKALEVENSFTFLQISTTKKAKNHLFLLDYQNFGGTFTFKWNFLKLQTKHQIEANLFFSRTSKFKIGIHGRTQKLDSLIFVDVYCSTFI